jgi:phosphoribosylformylglycinamidine (FGAM) synthase PurS component
VQDKTTIERGLFDDELVPEELTQVRMGKIIRDRYPELDSEDQEAIRQHAIAALNMTQQAKKFVNENSNNEMEASGSNAFIQGVRKYAMDVRDLDIDLIDHINPFSEAYAILAKAMNEDSLKQVQAIIVGKRIKLTIEEAREYAKRGLRFKQERGRLPSLSAVDPWEKKMAEGIAFLAQMKAEELNG